MLRRVRMVAIGGAFAAATIVALPQAANAQVDIHPPFLTINKIEVCITINPLGIPHTCVGIPETTI